MYFYQRLPIDVNDKPGNMYYRIVEGIAERAGAAPNVSLSCDLSSQLGVRADRDDRSLMRTARLAQHRPQRTAETVKQRGDENRTAEQRRANKA